MPRWLETCVRSVVAGVVVGVSAAIVNLTGGSSVLIVLAAILIVFGVCGDFRQG